MKHSILIAVHNSLGLLQAYLPRNLELLGPESEILLLDMSSQDNPLEYLTRYVPCINDAIDEGKLRLFKSCDGIQLNPAQGFNALSKYAKGRVLTFLTANNFIPVPHVYDNVLDGLMARPKFDLNTVVNCGVKLSVTAKDFKEHKGFYEQFSTFEFLMSSGLSIPSHHYVDAYPAVSKLPNTLGDVNSDVSRYFTANSIGLPLVNVAMGDHKIFDFRVSKQFATVP